MLFLFRRNGDVAAPAASQGERRGGPALKSRNRDHDRRVMQEWAKAEAAARLAQIEAQRALDAAQVQPEPAPAPEIAADAENRPTPREVLPAPIDMEGAAADARAAISEAFAQEVARIEAERVIAAAVEAERLRRWRLRQDEEILLLI